MTIGLIFLVIALILIVYAYLSYKKEAHDLFLLKQEDLVSYYIELVDNLLPVPLWSALIGIVLLLVAIIIILVSLPFVL